MPDEAPVMRIVLPSSRFDIAAIMRTVRPSILRLGLNNGGFGRKTRFQCVELIDIPNDEVTKLQYHDLARDSGQSLNRYTRLPFPLR